MAKGHGEKRYAESKAWGEKQSWLGGKPPGQPLDPRFWGAKGGGIDFEKNSQDFCGKKSAKKTLRGR